MSTEVQEALTAGEVSMRTIYEGVVTKGALAFMEVGTALMQLRDKRLFRDTHDDFAAYCFDKWQFTSRHINRLIAAEEVRQDLASQDPVGPQPSNERQLRPLTAIPREKRAEAWAEVVETAPTDDEGEPIITAKHVEQTVAKRKPAKAKEPAPPKSSTAPRFTKLAMVLDDWNTEYIAIAQECDEAAEVCDALDALRKKFDYYVRQVEAN